MNSSSSTTTTNTKNANIPSFLTVPSFSIPQQQQQLVTPHSNINKPSLNETFVLLDVIVKLLIDLKKSLIINESEFSEANNTMVYIKNSIQNYFTFESKIKLGPKQVNQDNLTIYDYHLYYLLVTQINNLTQQILSNLNILKSSTKNNNSNSNNIIANVLKFDSVLKFSFDQLLSLYPIQNTNSDVYNPIVLLSNQAREFWIGNFGENIAMVPWGLFFSVLQESLQVGCVKYEEPIKHVIDFTQDGHVSIYEFSIFLKWFGPLPHLLHNLIDTINAKIMSGFISGIEASKLLDRKDGGSYIIRFSKTSPGSFAVTFVDYNGSIRHCLLYPVTNGLTLQQPPDIFRNLTNFVLNFSSKLKHAIGPIDNVLLPPANENDIITLSNIQVKLDLDGDKNIYVSNVNTNVIISNIPTPTATPNSNIHSLPIIIEPIASNNSSTSTSGSASPNNHSPKEESILLKSPKNRKTRRHSRDEQHFVIPENNLITKDICIVCMDNPINTVFLECGHLSCCSTCSGKLKVCPLCRKTISRVVTIFRPS